MSPRTQKQFEEIREERREQIKRVALEVVSEEGFQNTSISKIAARANISKGLMYNYFESKEELIKEILLDGINDFINIFDPNKDGVLTVEEVKYFIDETFNILQKNLLHWRFYFSVIMQPKVMPLVKDKTIELLKPYLNTALNFYKNRGSENPMVDLRIMGAVLDGICMNYVMDPTNFPLDEIKDRLYKLLINIYRS